MTKARIGGWAAAAFLVILGLAAYMAIEQDADPAARSPETTPSASSEAHPSFLYGRVTTVGGATYEGRLRWGRNEEAFWGDYFNGVRADNPWVAHVPPEQLPTERRSIEFLGFEIGRKEREIELGRPFMARFGDIARIEAGVRDVRVTLRNGMVSNLDRLEASDFDDGVRVWDGGHGVVDLDSRLIRTIELLPSAEPGPAPYRLYGTVRTRQGDFTGFIQWNRTDSLGVDELSGNTAEGAISLRFDTISSIARDSRDGSRMILRDGRELVLSGTPQTGRGNRGIYVDDERYGRVLISWDAFERVDFSADGTGPAGSGPTYEDFPPGHPLTGSVTTRDSRRLAGRLVFDLDESETTETLDAPSNGVDYTILFGLIASVEPIAGEDARVILHSGEQLQLERAGDLGDGNGGMLIFVDGRERTEYVPWTDLVRVEFDRPSAMYPPVGEH